VKFWHILLAASTTIVSGCATISDQGSEVELKRTWMSGQHLLPQSALLTDQFSEISEIRDYPDNWAEVVSKQKLKPGSKLPAVVYLHGCAGNHNGFSWSNHLNKMGFAFFAPDSLARPRRSLCDTGNMRNIRIPMRTQELRFALDQVNKLDWIDQQRLVLLGFSEGAQTAAVYSGDEFSAVVLMGTNCKFSGGSPKTQSNIPVLSLMGANDHYYSGVGCTINRTVGGSRSIVIDRAEHNLRNNQTAIAELKKFLTQQLAEDE
jgi:dienelactone hydrolase